MLHPLSSPVQAQLTSPSSQPPATSPPPSYLPPLQAHPLPPALAAWRDRTQSGDYFEKVTPTRLGYLTWSIFPVTLYIEPVKADPHTSSFKREQAWVEAVTAAVQEWSQYLPLQIMDRPEADIAVWRAIPPLRLTPNNTAGLPAVPRARSAETRYEFYIRRQNSLAILSHRCTVLLRSGQASLSLQATARHEIGHALGIWGHSPLPSDALYFAQVRHPTGISARDINTLKRVYEQTTRLGWALPSGDLLNSDLRLQTLEKLSEIRVVKDLSKEG